MLYWDGSIFADNDAFRNQCYRSARQLVRRDRNHPCVMAWEVSLNETKMPIDFMEVLDSIVHKEYPGENVYSCGWMPEVYDIYFKAKTTPHTPQGQDDIRQTVYSI